MSINPLFFGLDAIGNAVNARTAANNVRGQAQASLADTLRQIEFERGQRQQAMEWESKSLSEQLATERRNLEKEIQVAEANRQAMLASVLENAAAQKASIGRQEQLVGDERSRQQQYARGQRDVLDTNVGLFGGMEGQIGDQAGGIAEAIMSFINANRPAGQAPGASGATADREAALRAQASGDVAGDVQRGANVNALGEVLGNIGVAMGRNNQLGDLLGNFAQGSASTLDPALEAARMVFEKKPILQDGVAKEQYISAGPFAAQRYISNPLPAGKTNMLGDLLKITAGLGEQGVFSRLMQPSPYSLMAPGESFNRSGLQRPTAPNLDYMGGGQGLSLSGGNTGLVLRSNLGIR